MADSSVLLNVSHSLRCLISNPLYFWPQAIDRLTLFYSPPPSLPLAFDCQYRPLVWRNTHPYVLVDRHEDVTDPNAVDENSACDRSIVYYGYVRGTHLKPGMKVHVIGVGDFGMASVSALPDPLPLPDKESERKVRVDFHRRPSQSTTVPNNLKPLLSVDSRVDSQKEGRSPLCSAFQCWRRLV